MSSSISFATRSGSGTRRPPDRWSSPRRTYAAAILGALLCGCGEPSPWANVVARGYTDLTRQELRRLGGADADSSPFRVGLIADPQTTPGHLRLALRALDARNDIAFTLILGDLTDRSLRAEFLWVAKAVIKSRHPVLTVVGNHDGLIYGEEIYEDVFGALDYSFLYRGIKFVMWNDNPFEWGYPDFAWLRREIDGHPRVIIAAHQPPGFIERFPEANTELAALYEHPHVMGSVHGHLHEYAFRRLAGKPVMTVDRVIGPTYAVMHVGADASLAFEHCRGSTCQLQAY